MMESTVSRRTFNSFSRKAIYTHPPLPDAEEGDPIVTEEIRVVADIGIERYNEYNELIYDVDTVDFLNGTVDAKKYGELTIAGFDGKKWRLLSREMDDGFVTTWKMERIE